jgi:cullin 1
VEGAVQTLTTSKLLISTPKGSDFVLELAQEFASGGELDLVSRSDKGEIEVKAMEELKADRKLMVEAIIVKIMKSEKMAKRDELLVKTAPLLAQRGFNFNADFVEKSIDRLLDKEFLRDFEDGTLGYIA